MKYKDRQGNRFEDDSAQDKLLNLLYTHRAGRLLLKPLVCPAVSIWGGKLLSTKLSSLFIRPFVEKNRIDLTQYEKQTFPSYNSFFSRKIKQECRPVEKSDDVLISPCDGKLSVYRIDEHSHFCIKHTEYTLKELLHSQKSAERYEDGYACVFRLTVDDYHRYCYMDDGQKSKNFRIRGLLHTVNPIANDVYPIYKENAREYCLIKSKNFGTLLQMEVGALMVGRIHNYHGASSVRKGQEKGRFEFGGSTIVVLLQKDIVDLDPELLKNTEEGYETIVRMGSRIGTKSINCDLTKQSAEK